MVSDSAVEPTPAVATGPDAAFVRGIARLDDRLVILLALDALFGAAEIGELAVA